MNYPQYPVSPKSKWLQLQALVRKLTVVLSLHLHQCLHQYKHQLTPLLQLLASSIAIIILILTGGWGVFSLHVKRETQEQCFFFGGPKHMFFAVLFRVAPLPRTFVFIFFSLFFFDGKKHTVLAVLFLSLTVFHM